MTNLLRSGTAGLGSCRPAAKPFGGSWPAVGRARLSKEQRKARIAALTPLVLQRLKKRACSMKMLMSDPGLDAYETELRIILLDLVNTGRVSKSLHKGRPFYKGI